MALPLLTRKLVGMALLDTFATAALGRHAARPHPAVALPSLGLRRLEQQALRTREGTVCALGLLLDLRDLRTGLHATRLTEWAARVGEMLGLDPEQQRDVEHASLLHDLGKVGIADEVLKKPGRLSADEWELVRRHPEYGWAILREIPGFEQVSLLVLHHHERFDGKGYPAGLKGDRIPLGARIVAVVDAFDAMISTRCYRDGLPATEVFARMREASGTQFDPRILELFLELAAAEAHQIDRLAAEDDLV